MSTSPRPSPLRAAAQNKGLWLVVPAIAVLAGLVWVGRSAVTAPAPVETAATAQTGGAPAVAHAPVDAAPQAAQLVEIADTSPAPQAAAATAAEPVAFNDDQKQQIETIIKEYLLANPEIFLDVQTALEQKLEKQQAEKLKSVISDNAKDIYRHPDAAVAGNPDGDITVVEFFDYNCGYCKRGLDDIVKLVDTDSKVRVVFKELPILSKGSEEASHIALAAKRQGKYWEMHRALLSAKGHVNEASALRIAEKLGLDMEKLKADMASDEVAAEVQESEDLAKKLGVNGTPHFLVGDRAIPGAPEDLYEQLEKQVTELRNEGCAYC